MEALKYYQMSVEKGNEKAMLIYGKILLNGVKTAENKRKAIEAIFLYASYCMIEMDFHRINKKQKNQQIMKT